MKGFIEVTTTEFEQLTTIAVKNIMRFCGNTKFVTYTNIYLENATGELLVQCKESYEEIKSKIEEAQKRQSQRCIRCHKQRNARFKRH